MTRKRDFIPYVAPFGLFGLLTYLINFFPFLGTFGYAGKTVITAMVLWIFRGHFQKQIVFKFDFLAVSAGILVFLLWVGLEGTYPLVGESTGYNPRGSAAVPLVYVLIVFRIAGASLVVPVMEELFWRSFALRFLIDTDFKRIPFGAFTWFSFIMTSVAFGFEHHRWLPGIFAGMVYALLYYRTKNLFSPILSHSVTNLLLGLYVLWSGHWSFW